MDTLRVLLNYSNYCVIMNWAVVYERPGGGMMDEPRGQTRSALAFSNRQFPVRLEFVVTSTKQSLRPHSNRHNRDGSGATSPNFSSGLARFTRISNRNTPNSENRANP